MRTLGIRKEKGKATVRKWQRTIHPHPESQFLLPPTLLPTFLKGAAIASLLRPLMAAFRTYVYVLIIRSVSANTCPFKDTMLFLHSSKLPRLSPVYIPELKTKISQALPISNMIQVESPLCEIARTNSIFDFRFFLTLVYLHMHSGKYCGWNPNMNMRFIYVSYRLYTHSLK